jgi:hypothetical protein
MNDRLLFGIVFAIGVLAGCDKSNGRPQQRAVDVVSKSLEFARKDSVDISSYSVMSVIRMRDGRQSVVKIDDEMTGFDRHLYAKLLKKKYWEVCYKTSSDFMAGAIYCYYFDDDEDLKFIAAFRVK